MAGAPPMPDESQHLPPPHSALVGGHVGATVRVGVAVGSLVEDTAGAVGVGGVGGAGVGEDDGEDDGEVGAMQ